MDSLQRTWRNCECMLTYICNDLYRIPCVGWVGGCVCVYICTCVHIKGVKERGDRAIIVSAFILFNLHLHFRSGVNIDMEDDVLPKDLNLPLDSSLTDNQPPGLPAVAGKKIYTIGRRGHGGKHTQTPRLRKHTSEEAGSVAENGESAASNVSLNKTAKFDSRSSRSSKRNKQAKRGDDVDSGSDDESSMEVDDPEEEVNDLVQKNKIRRSTNVKKVVSSSDSELSTDQSDDEELAAHLNRMAKSGGNAAMTDEVLEDYFAAHSSKKGIATSDHTLAKLSHPKMDQQSMEKALNKTPSRFQRDRLQLCEEYKQLYPYWLFQLSNGFNVLLYGVGSKQKLLEDFRKECLSESCHLVVNGFFPGLTIKQMLTKLTTDIFGHSGAFKSPVEQAVFIARELKMKARSEMEPSRDTKTKRAVTDSVVVPSEIFFVIHNIDGQMLRSDTAQSALSILAQSPSIRIIASVDHINAPLLWDQKKLSRFNWLWHDTTTYEPYRNETSYENSLLVQQSGSLALSSLIHVTNSLTPNARGIFELLVNYQLENRGETDGVYLGMSFHDCYLKCREKFLVNSDVTLRSQLTEFKDHKLVRSRRGHDGVEYLYIPVDNAALSQFLEQAREE